ncbi:hypothetical protein [Stenotrophomonas maltophilia]|uniref:hypothetical protein n=1 Tax=Stenotrophomonas maltophilia TaxID=40324 RepID=UPI001F536A10|nr:hypothetical protein [Stenotrophomonas maltophilia]MCI1124770.1 hypothetical protein [Stenotrophomonas maltophilia]
MDVEQRARELLAAEIEKLIRKNEDTPRVRQCYEVAEQIRAGSQLGPVMAVCHAAIIAALTPPEGYVLVPVEPTEAMLDAGRAAVMAEHCAGPKWTPRQHFEASGRSTAGIPEDVLDECGPLTKESTAAMVFGSMLAARPEVKP